MVFSMTGFARTERLVPQGKLSLELKSVNHRYLEVSLRLPTVLRFAEAELRAAVQQHLSRGKVDLSVLWQGNELAGGGTIDSRALAQLTQQLEDVRRAVPESPMPDALTLLNSPGVRVDVGVDESALAEAVNAALRAGLEQLNDHRRREGAALGESVFVRLDAMAAIVAELRAAASSLSATLYQRLQERVQKLQVDVSPERLNQELVMLAQRADVDEELDRLDAHIAETRQILTQEGPIGRRLDFLMQEFNREANTLGSKAAQTQYTQAAIDLKVLIEQMREQIQNIE